MATSRARRERRRRRDLITRTRQWYVSVTGGTTYICIQPRGWRGDSLVSTSTGTGKEDLVTTCGRWSVNPSARHNVRSPRCAGDRPLYFGQGAVPIPASMPPLPAPGDVRAGRADLVRVHRSIRGVIDEIPAAPYRPPYRAWSAKLLSRAGYVAFLPLRLYLRRA